MAMEPHKLRFVRCPKCLQLLVENPSIPVYQCGCCGTILRAKHRGAPLAHTSSESCEDNNFPCNFEGPPEKSKVICLDEQNTLPSNAQPTENVMDEQNTLSSNAQPTENVKGDISSVTIDGNPCENVNQERTMVIGENATTGEIDNVEKCLLIDGNARCPESMIKEKDDEDTRVNSSPKMVNNVEASVNVNVEKGNSMDDANIESVVREVVAVHGMEGKELRVDSSNTMRGEIESVTEHNCSTSNKIMRCQHIAERNKLHEEDEAKFDDMLIQGEERSQQYKCLRIESYEDLIEELERSLSLRDDEEDYLDVTDNNGLNDALHHQIGSRRFSAGSKINDASRNDPHGQLIEELENSFSDAEEPLEHHVEVVEKDISEKVHGNEQWKDPLFLVDESANPNEGSVSSSDDEHTKSGQDFQQNGLAAGSTSKKEDAHVEDDNRTDSVHENVMVTNKDMADEIHKNEHDEDMQYLVAESANLCEGSISSSSNEHLKFVQSFQQNDLTTDGTEEMEESCMEDHSIINCVHVNEDIAERIHGNEHDMDPQYLGIESTNLCEEGIYSFNYVHLKSGLSFQQHELIADGTEQKKEGYAEDENMAICVQADNAAAVAGFSSLPNERIHFQSPSFTKKKEEISCRYRASLLRQGLSLDSEDFNSIQKFIDSQMDGTSSSLSSGSPNQGDLVLKTSNKFKPFDQHGRLKKMDDLRDQLNRLSGQKGMERRYQKKDIEYQLQLNSYDAEQHLESADADSIPSSCTLDSYYGHVKPPRYPPTNSSSPPHSCAHYHFGHVQPHIPHNYDAWEFNSYYQSSHGGSSILDHGSLKSSFKEQKRVVRKHILRPLSGASPYTVCSSCFNLVQVPSDIYMSKRKIGKMQCGQCSKVIMLSCPAVNHANSSTVKEVAQKASKSAGRTNYETEDASYPVSINESYEASFTRRFTTHAGSVLTAAQSSKKVSESALHRLMGYDSASQLLRHSRVFERHSRVFDDGYESFESMVPVSNRVSRRKNM